MKWFGVDEDGLTIKDFYGVIFTLSFLAICWIAVWQRTNPATFTVLNILSPIILTILGGYIVTEGAKQVIPTLTKQSEDTKVTAPVSPPAPTSSSTMNDKV